MNCSTNPTAGCGDASIVAEIKIQTNTIVTHLDEVKTAIENLQAQNEECCEETNANLTSIESKLDTLIANASECCVTQTGLFEQMVSLLQQLLNCECPTTSTTTSTTTICIPCPGTETTTTTEGEQAETTTTTEAEQGEETTTTTEACSCCLISDPLNYSFDSQEEACSCEGEYIYPYGDSEDFSLCTVLYTDSECISRAPGGYYADCLTALVRHWNGWVFDLPDVYCNELTTTTTTEIL